MAGVVCCQKMHKNLNQSFSHHFFCYDARNIYDANMLILWGYIPPKLQELLDQYYSYLPTDKFIIHIATCNRFGDQSQVLKTHLRLSCESWEAIDLKHIIKEARQCLRA